MLFFVIVGHTSEDATGLEERNTMIEISILSVIVLTLFTYLVYTPLQPKKF
jgi:hypothetical protein